MLRSDSSGLEMVKIERNGWIRSEDKEVDETTVDSGLLFHLSTSNFGA